MAIGIWAMEDKRRVVSGILVQRKTVPVGPKSRARSVIRQMSEHPASSGNQDRNSRYQHEPDRPPAECLRCVIRSQTSNKAVSWTVGVSAGHPSTWTISEEETMSSNALTSVKPAMTFVKLITHDPEELLPFYEEVFGFMSPIGLPRLSRNRLQHRGDPPSCRW